MTLHMISPPGPVERAGVVLRPVDEGEWLDFLGRADFVCQEQLPAFALARYHGFDVEPVLFEQEGRTIGGSLMLVRKLPLGLVQLAITKWGPLSLREDEPGHLARYRGMVDALRDHYSRRRGMVLSVMPRPTINDDEYQQLLAAGYSEGEALHAPLRYFVDVRQDDAGLRAGYAQKWRNRLNKANRSGLVFARATAADEPEFGAMFRSMVERKNYVDHSAYDLVPRLLSDPRSPLGLELFLVRLEGRAIAGALVVTAGRTATYLYGATLPEALPVSAGHFLQDNIVRWLRDNTRVRWYNMGGHDGNEGLRTFKAGMVGNGGVEADFAPAALVADSPRARLLGLSALALRDRLMRLKSRLGR